MLLLRGRTYAATDQLDIARDLIRTAQAEPGGGTIRVALGSEASGVLRDRSYLAGDMPVVGELLAQLGAVAGGFDLAWPVELGPDGLPRGRLLLGYPRLGTIEPAFVVDLPRSISFSRDATALAVTSYAVGAKPAAVGDVQPPTPVASATDPALLDAGLLPLSKVTAYSTVTDPTTLQGHADADQQAAGGTLQTVKVTVSMGRVLGNGVQPGDPVLCYFTGPRFPNPSDVEPVPGQDPVTSVVTTGDAYADLYADLYAGALTSVTTPGTPATPGGSRGPGYSAVLRITAMDYDPGAGTVDLTLAPRVTQGGRIPTAATDAATLARLSRQLRQLATS
jgi:hypothetical protein